MGQEAESEWKVSWVRQMPIQCTVGRKYTYPFMVLTVAGHVPLMMSDPSAFI